MTAEPGGMVGLFQDRGDGACDIEGLAERQDQAETTQLHVSEHDADLSARLSDELDSFNAVAAPGPSAVLLSVKCDNDQGELLGGITGWTW
ncbi:MAG: hypothetical protein ACTHMS_00350 [Jatrophihabitans sp.]|uniref:hypothetical protein n=1 Tax=Jatrophihabitans sp. TaxID=1932789 RepID=UPI003F7E3331